MNVTEQSIPPEDNFFVTFVTFVSQKFYEDSVFETLCSHFAEFTFLEENNKFYKLKVL